MAKPDPAEIAAMHAERGPGGESLRPRDNRGILIDRPDPTENARRAARFKFAQDRIKRIVDGLPPLTDEQLTKLAVLLRPGD